ncbi:MAG: aspartate aminotransferase family protein [Gemmatimonadetes bacterium]|nr:aspartate aminotransferase family protein [Gemmatimonadota bacterium]MDE3260057.1 aspartate aminotransferase family protein [Gemmatimonadota bacterium]
MAQVANSMTLEKRKIPGPGSAELLEVSREYEPPCMADQVPVVWDHGEGVWVWDVDGNRFLDFTSGVLVTNLGHSHPRHVERIREQAGRLMNCYSFPTPERVTLSKRLTDLLPDNIDQTFLLTTGAEATEAAIRIAKRFTGKHEVLSFYGGFHGRTYGPMSVAGSKNTRRAFGPQLPGGILAPFPYFYRDFYRSETEEECAQRCLENLDRIIDSTSTGDLGAVITEPYQGGAGFIFPPAGWLKGLEAWARKRGLVFILDEVQSSFGRTGKLFALDWEDLQPNMVCLGKGIGSGMPASALAGESRIFECMGTGEMSSTCGGNPLASAASHAVLDAMEDERLPENAQRVGAYMIARFQAMKAKYPVLGDVRGQGLVIGLEFVLDPENKTPAPELTSDLLLRAGEYGLLLGKVGLYGNVVRIAPPLVISEREAGLGIDILDRALEELAG